VRDGDEWVINGQKIWNSGTLTADRGLLVARTNPDVPKHRGISFFVIDVDQPGIEIRTIRQMNGRAEFNETFFTDARVADTARIGEVNGGFPVAMTTLVAERSTFAGGGERRLVSAQAGAKAGDLDRIVGEVLANHGSNNSRFDLEIGGANALPVGTPAALIDVARHFKRSTDLRIRQRIAEIYAASEALRFTELRARAALQSGRKAGPESSIGYLGRVRIVRACRDLSAELAGPAAMLAGPDAPLDGAVTLSVTTAPCHGIQGGTEQIQRNIIGERILGLPKEPQVDRDIPFRQVKVGTQRS
jgi:alkylation response protein AidB-like acyl-CoA dehydrogenase